MMSLVQNWFLITIAVYVLHTVNVVIDKFLLGRRIDRASVYAFLSGILSVFVLVLLPYASSAFPSGVVVGYSLLAGFAFVFALYFYSYAIQHDDASRVAPLIGGIAPLFVVWFSWLLWSEKLNGNDLSGFLLLAGGMIVLALSGFLKDSYTLKEFGATLVSAFLFAVSYFFAKATFNEVLFIDGVIWIRMGAFFASLLFLASPAVRNFFRSEQKNLLWGSTGALLLGNKLLGALALLFLNYAIALAPHVGIVNALQGIEFVLVFCAATALSHWYPAILEEKLTVPVLALKTIAILLVGIGVFFIARPLIHI
ncbi:MAG: EamA family transporter [bacterium]|nr:EamA family transporter [bacterium]